MVADNGEWLKATAAVRTSVQLLATIDLSCYRNPMRKLVLCVFVGALQLSCAKPLTREENLMREIESAIVLPKDARPLSAYGRNYAFGDNNSVIARYLFPLAVPDPSDGCEVMLAKGAARPCTEAEVAESVRSSERSSAQQAPAGSSRWFDDRRMLPSIADGGCMEINIEYAITTHKFVRLACNGEA